MNMLTWDLANRLINERGLDVDAPRDKCLDDEMFNTLKEYHEALVTIKRVSNYVKGKALEEKDGQLSTLV
jgi:hypothetical protein